MQAGRCAVTACLAVLVLVGRVRAGTEGAAVLPAAVEVLLAGYENNLAKIHSVSAKAEVTVDEPGQPCRDRDGNPVGTRTAQVAFWRDGALQRLDTSWDKICADGKVTYWAAPVDYPGRTIPDEDRKPRYTIRSLQLADAVHEYFVEGKSGDIRAPDNARPLDTGTNWLVRGPTWHSEALRETISGAVGRGATVRIEQREGKQFDLAVTVTFKSGDGESVGTNRATFDGTKGYTIQAIDSSNTGNKFSQRTRYSYQQVGDVWFLVAGEHVTVGADGKEMFRTRLSVDENSLKVNQPVDPVVFTVDDLHIAKGAAISNALTGENYYYNDVPVPVKLALGKAKESIGLDKKAAFPPPLPFTPSPAERSLSFWRIVGGILAVILALGAVVLYVRRPKRRVI